MNPEKLVERTSKSFNLKVFKVDDGSYYVENSTGKVCYKILLDEGTKSCTCADFQKHIHQDPDFRCCHIIAVLNSASDPEQVKYIQRYKPKLDKQFITNIKGKDFVLYSGLLDLAHQKGILRITVDVEQFPTSENGDVAVCKAIVESVTGEEFVEWGDANPKNVNYMVVDHILRVAATRAKARALRDFTNIGMTCMEELGGTDEVEVQKPKPEIKQKAPATRKKETNKQAVKPAEKSRPPSKPIPFNNKQMTGKPTVPAKEKPAPEPIPVSQNQEKRKPSMAQLKAIENLASRRGVKTEMLDDLTIEQFGVKHQYISQNDASALIRYLQKSA